MLPQALAEPGIRHRVTRIIDWGDAVTRTIGQPGACQGPPTGGTAFFTGLRPPYRRRMNDSGGRVARQATLLVRHCVRRIIDEMVRDHAPPLRRRAR
ncbi:MAG: hypothetical protein HXY39_05025 [Chloroflexi bacterium]|nr:hypothetical protein [Chloroflexota bacterium]